MSRPALSWLPALPAAAYGGVVAVGNFDGVHQGHQVLLDELTKLARSLHAPPVVVTFDPHPMALLRPEEVGTPLTTIPDRVWLLRSAGVAEVIVLPTTHELLRCPAEMFFDRFLVECLGLRGMVEGPDFRFGKDRTGDVARLRAWCAARGLPLVIAPWQTAVDGVISTRRIRQALCDGKLGDAELMLGRPYFLSGRVATGQQRGRTLGFPTANLEAIATTVPAEGVYAVGVEWGDRWFGGAANIGANPTFGETERKVEVHLLDFTGDLYGEILRLHFLARLRDTRKFTSLDTLRAQLHMDVEQARLAVAQRSMSQGHVA